MNKKQSLREMRRKAEREQKAEKQRQAAAILATKDLEERKRLLAKAMADSEKEARNQAVEYCFHSIYAAVLLAAILAAHWKKVHPILLIVGSAVVGIAAGYAGLLPGV